eukprot:315136-Amphidinium_carterae.1
MARNLATRKRITHPSALQPFVSKLRNTEKPQAHWQQHYIGFYRSTEFELLSIQERETAAPGSGLRVKRFSSSCPKPPAMPRRA